MTVVLVTGGAGYVGAHACKALRAAGYTPVTFDNLETGWREAVKYGPLEEGDLADRDRLDEVFARWNPVAVMHFAAISLVGEAMRDPGRYWRVNLLGALNLVEAALAADCRNFVFSSTCATYGDQDGVVLDETSAQMPLNAYGKSKLAIEQMLGDFAASHGLRPVIFRYFNVAGADPDGDVGEFHQPETHLIPLMLDAIEGKRPALTVHGTDYPTPDGTCIRDYIHVCDLASAHALALNYLRKEGETVAVNLGTGKGFSVKEIITTAEAVTGRTIPVSYGERRAGDPSELIADPRLAKQILQWQAVHLDPRDHIDSAWRWMNGTRRGRYAV